MSHRSTGVSRVGVCSNVLVWFIVPGQAGVFFCQDEQESRALRDLNDKKCLAKYGVRLSFLVALIFWGVCLVVGSRHPSYKNKYCIRTYMPNGELAIITW